MEANLNLGSLIIETLMLCKKLMTKIYKLLGEGLRMGLVSKQYLKGKQSDSNQ